MKHMLTQKIGSLLGIAVVALFAVTLTSTSAHALLAAGTTISNTAHVDWDEDGSGLGLDSPPVVVTVNLVSGLVWDDTTLTPTQTVTPGATITDYTIDLLNTGNGTTTVTLTDNTVDTGLNADSVFATSPTVAADLTLVGTVASGAGAAGGGGTWVIPVYNLDFAALEVGVTRIHINGATGTYYTVAAGSTATQLVVTGAPVIAAGDQLGEVISITYSGDAATLAASPTTGTHDHALLASDDVGGGLNADGKAAASDTVESNADGATGTDWVTTVAVSALDIDKYVRNNTGANPAAAADITYNGIDYWLTGVTGDTGDVLEYLVVIANNGGGAATNVVMTDAISTFLALNAGTISLDETNNGTFDTTDAITSSDASYAAPNLTVFAGVGGANPTGGSVAGGASTAIVFQATIQ